MKLTKKVNSLLGIEESINDKNILKAIILAGGPGSGKSFVIEQVIGKAGPVSGLGAVISASDKFFEKGLEKLNIPLKFDDNNPELFKKQMDVREIAKATAQTKLNSIIDGLLPLVLDGTGQDLTKIKKQKKALENIGYDVDMIFVNTSLEVAQERNRTRPRSLTPRVVQELWDTVQNNLGEFQSIFGKTRFHLVDNSKTLEGSDFKTFKAKMFKMGMSILNEPVKNPKGRALTQALKSVNGKYLSDLSKLPDVPV